MNFTIGSLIRCKKANWLYGIEGGSKEHTYDIGSLFILTNIITYQDHRFIHLYSCSLQHTLVWFVKANKAIDAELFEWFEIVS